VSKNLWVIRPEPNYINRLAEFLDKGIVAIGWPRVGDLGVGLDREALGHRLSQAYAHYRDVQKSDLAVAAGILDRFVNQIQDGDFVLVPQGGEVYAGQTEGGYIFRSDFGSDGPEGGYPHWRKVRYLKGKDPYCAIKDLPLGVRRAIDCRLSVFSIRSAVQAMWDFLGLEPE
jgi:predicted Mrr-cat superfamily restriction endonuclease